MAWDLFMLKKFFLTCCKLSVNPQSSESLILTFCNYIKRTFQRIFFFKERDTKAERKTEGDTKRDRALSLSLSAIPDLPRGGRNWSHYYYRSWQNSEGSRQWNPGAQVETMDIKNALPTELLLKSENLDGILENQYLQDIFLNKDNESLERPENIK